MTRSTTSAVMPFGGDHQPPLKSQHAFYAWLTSFPMGSDVIRCQISMSIKVAIRILTLALTVSEIITLQMSYLENLGQGHRAYHLQ